MELNSIHRIDKYFLIRNSLICHHNLYENTEARKNSFSIINFNNLTMKNKTDKNHVKIQPSS